MKQGRYEWQEGKPVYISSRTSVKGEESVFFTCFGIGLILILFLFA
jgi:hypothetical protein